MTLILSNDDVERLLTMPDCIEALEEAYVEMAEGRGISRQRSDCITPTSYSEDAIYGLKSMDGVVPKLGVGAIRINSDIVTNPMIGNTRRRVKIPAAPNNRYVGLVLLFSTHNGEPLAIFPDGVLQRMRVGATNGLGVKYMARKDASTIGLLGSGWQAETQLTAACVVRKITSVKCYSPNKDNCTAFAARMTQLAHGRSLELRAHVLQLLVLGGDGHLEARDPPVRGGELGGACLALEGCLAQMGVQLVRPVTACPHLGTRRLEQLVERADLIVPGEQLRLLPLFARKRWTQPHIPGHARALTSAD